MDLLEWGLLLSAAGAFTAGGGLIVNGLSYRLTATVQRLKVMTDINHEFTELEASQERNSDYPLFGAKYLNLADQTAFLVLHDMIPKDVARYFDVKFQGCLGLLLKPEFQQYREGLQSLTKWCKSVDLKAGQAPEPYRQEHAESK